MMAVFGETFADEIIAAGLGGLPFAWSPDSGNITGRENLTAAQNTMLDAVISVHDPRATIPPATPRQQIVNKLRTDPIFKAGIIDSFEARGITDRTAILDALEAKFADTRI